MHEKYENILIKEELSRHLVDNIKDYAIFMLDATGHVVTWNPVAECIMGYSAEEITGKYISLFYTTEEIVAKVPEYDLERARQEGRCERESRRVRKNGSWFRAQVILTALYDDQKQIRGFSKITKDTSERNKFEDQLKSITSELEERIQKKSSELQTAQDRLHFHLENSPLAFIEWDNQIRPKSWSKQAGEIFGWTAEEATSNQLEWFSKVYAEDMAQVSKVAEQLKAGILEKIHIQHRNYTKDGRIVWCEWFNSVLKDEDGKVITILSLIQDITERKSTELSIVESEQKYRAIIETAQEGIWQIDEQDNIAFVNEYMALLLGYTPREMIGKSIFLFLDESAKAKAIKNINERRQGLSSQHEFTFFNKNHVAVHTLIQSTPIFNSDKYSGFLSMVLDITKRKKAEEELRLSEYQYRYLFENNPLPMLMLDYPKKNFILVNNAFIEKFGYSREELTSMTIMQLRRPGEAHQSQEVERVLTNKQLFKGTMFYRTKAGVDLLFDVHAFESMFEGRAVYIGALNDITVQTRAKEDLEQKNKQLRELASHLQNIREEERTSMAREIHDELGQRLTAIKIGVSLLGKKIRSADQSVGQKFKDLFDLIDGTIQTIRRISTELRPSVLDHLGLAEAIQFQVKEFTERSGIAVNFISNITEEKVSPGVTTAVFRIFQEALTNIARHAQATMVVCELAKDDHQVALKITDNGIGFQPHQITKGKTLGLLGMKERVAMLNGKYEIISEEKKGTVIAAKIPLTQMNNE